MLGARDQFHSSESITEQTDRVFVHSLIDMGVMEGHNARVANRNRHDSGSEISGWRYKSTECQR